MNPVTAVLGEPMGAPEDGSLRWLRISILAACAVVLTIIAGLAPLRAALGNVPALVVGVALLALLGLVPVYVRLKNRRDAEHLDFLIASYRPAEGEDGC